MVIEKDASDMHSAMKRLMQNDGLRTLAGLCSRDGGPTPGVPVTLEEIEKEFVL